MHNYIVQNTFCQYSFSICYYICMNNDINGDNQTPVILVCLRTDEPEEEFERAVCELKSLCEACELESKGILTQTLAHPDNATCIGSGKAQELKYHIDISGAQFAVCLKNLSPAQMKNLQKIIEVPVWDRTRLILEIFSKRARTREAVLQVETAYLQYMLPRLGGMWQHLGRQGGGGGSRANKGIGEKQIELDRRQISHRITELKKELAKIEQVRYVQRSGRGRDGYRSVALVGYTNAGKSSLMNRLLDMSDTAPETGNEKKVFEKDMLFATLDTSVRKISVPGKKTFLLSDTVGFIENIPHDLIKAFRSTLSELKYADVLLIVMDSSDPNHREHLKVTEDTLNELDAKGIPSIYVYNKSDLRDPEMTVKNMPGSESVYISARSGYGIEDLLNSLEKIFSEGDKDVDTVIPYTSGDLLNRLHREARVISEDYVEEGVHIKAKVPSVLAASMGL